MIEGNVRIAAIDDENTVLDSFKMILEIKNYDVSLFESAMEFLKDFKKDSYDIIFLDLLLKKDPPPYNDTKTRDGGVKILLKIKEIDPDVEVIIVTGFATEKTHSNAITYGAMDYLSKPFVMEDIYDLINRAIRKRRDKKSSKKKGGSIGPVH